MSRRSHERLAAIVLALSVPLGAQDSAEAPVDKLRAHMTGALKQQPNFTCVETVERSVLGARELTFRLLDRVRLEVALVNRKEMFAFPGTSEFGDDGLRAFVPRGMFGNGSFALYADAVFENKGAELTFHGETDQNQRRALQYDFRMPQESGMTIHGIDAEATVSYRGSLYADPGTLDLKQLDFAAEAMPVKLGLREATGSISFARARIGDNEVLLPSSSQFVMITWMGDTYQNRMTFSECREYSGKSTLTFGGAGLNGALQAKSSKREIQIPRDLPMVVRLVGEINVEDIAIGDPVHAVLDQDLRNGGTVLLPKGATVLGNLVRAAPLGNSLLFGFMFQEAESETAHARLELLFQRATGSDLIALGPMRTVAPNPEEATIRLRPGVRRLGRDIRLYWRTYSKLPAGFR